MSITLLTCSADGTAFWNQVAMSPIHDPQGRFTHLVAIVTDVDARVTADAKGDAAPSAEQAARAEAETANDQMGILADATSTSAATLDVGECLARLSALVVLVLADWVVLATSEGRGHLGEPATRHREGRTEEMNRYAQLLATASNPASVLHQILAGGPALLVSDYPSPHRRVERATRVADSSVLEAAEQLGAVHAAARARAGQRGDGTGPRSSIAHPRTGGLGCGL